MENLTATSDALKPDDEIDHMNGNPLDNRKSNLRICEYRENLRNPCIRKNNTNGYPGIWKNHLGRFRAAILVNYRKINLGTYATFEETVEARIKAENRYHGEFAGHIRRENANKTKE